MEETCHKILLIILKYIPFIIAIIYFTSSILHCFGIRCYLLGNLFFLSPITALFILVASFAFRFCIWHRLPIYYSLILHGIACLDYYCSIPITSNIMLFIYLLITIIFILVGMYLKNRYNKKKRYGQNRNT
jgi:hypothetical protein